MLIPLNAALVRETIWKQHLTFSFKYKSLWHASIREAGYSRSGRRRSLTHLMYSKGFSSRFCVIFGAKSTRAHLSEGPSWKPAKTARNWSNVKYREILDTCHSNQARNYNRKINSLWNTKVTKYELNKYIYFWPSKITRNCNKYSPNQSQHW